MNECDFRCQGCMQRLCLEKVFRRIPVEYKFPSFFDNKYAST